MPTGTLTPFAASAWGNMDNLSGPQSPEGAESLPSAEQPGNKLRSGVDNPTQRYLNGGGT